MKRKGWPSGHPERFPKDSLPIKRPEEAKIGLSPIAPRMKRKEQPGGHSKKVAKDSLPKKTPKGQEEAAIGYYP